MENKKLSNILVIIGIIICIVFLFNMCSSSDKEQTYNLKCDWCGKEEECKLYCVQSLDGYNRDGSFKYKYDYLNFSDSCYIKAKNNGGQYGWLNIAPVK